MFRDSGLKVKGLRFSWFRVEGFGDLACGVIDSVAAYYWGYNLIPNLGNPYTAAEVDYASGYRQGYMLRVLSTVVTKSRERPSRVYGVYGLGTCMGWRTTIQCVPMAWSLKNAFVGFLYTLEVVKTCIYRIT